MQLSVVVPAYNEGRCIRRNIAAVEKALEKRAGNYEIIIVDDGSTDGTLQEAKAVKSKKIRVVSYAGNRGKGYALKFGTQYANGDYIAFLDADLEIAPGRIFELLDALKSCDIAIFSKNHPLSQINFPLFRRLLSKAYYLLAKVLLNLPVSDTQTGCKAFRRNVLERVLPYVYTRGFAFDLELLAYARDYDYSIRELPLRISFRRVKGRIKLENVLRMMLDTLIIFYRCRIKKIHRWPLWKI